MILLVRTALLQIEVCGATPTGEPAPSGYHAGCCSSVMGTGHKHPCGGIQPDHPWSAAPGAAFIR